MSKKIRNSNFELMRIISMFLIVLYHTIYHGHIIQNSTTLFLKTFFLILEIITIVHVNSFVLVSGYYQCESKFKIKKIIKLWLENLFYSLTFIFIFSYFNIIEISKFSIIKNLLFLNINEYWFIKIYLLLFCFTPFLNIIIKNTSKRDHKILIGLLIIFFSIIPTISGQEILNNNGYTLIQFILLYFIGAYLKKYPLNLKNNKMLIRLVSIVIFSLCVTINYGLLFYINKIDCNKSEFIAYVCNNINISYLSYSNPLILIQSVAYFIFFLTFSFQSKIINKIASLVLGIYFIHDNEYVRAWIYTFLKIDNGLIYSRRYIIYFIKIVFLIYISCLIIESIRKFIIYLIIKLKNKITEINVIENK